MATVRCDCIGDTYIRLWMSDITLWADSNFGHLNDYIVGTFIDPPPWAGFTILVPTDRYASILQFDITPVLSRKITGVNLIERIRPNVTEVQPRNPIALRVQALEITSGDVVIERAVTWNNFNSHARGVNTRDYTVSPPNGIALNMLDITASFTPDAVREGIFSIRLDSAIAPSLTPPPQPQFIPINNGYIGHSREFNPQHPHLEITTEPLLSLPPTSLQPTYTRNPAAPITFSWWSTPNPEWFLEDPQTASELTVWQDGVASRTFTIQGDTNEITLPAATFTQMRPVFYRVRTQTQHNGWGAWSETATFPLNATPPLAPLLTYPVNISVTGTSGVMLEWVYNSEHDTFPTRFDIRYRIDGGEWANLTNHSNGSTPARTTAETQAISGQARVEWQVRAYGELGDIGAWSEVAAFYTIGAPNPPTIVNVTSSNRPTINFSASNIASWQIEIWQDENRIYDSGNRPFEGVFSHTTNQFFANGNYIVRMRITNEFGIHSGWAERPVAIHTTLPKALTLRAANNVRHFIRLFFDNPDSLTVYVYRSVWQENNFLRIGKTSSNDFADYTVAPGIRYEYFVRSVTPQFSFADSNRQTGLSMFDETTFAKTDSLQNMLMLELQAGGMPTKDATFGVEKSLTNFIGRKKPVMQIGEHTGKVISFSFYCSRDVHAQLECLAESGTVLLMRDKRHGSIYGTITGSISARLHEVLDGFIISFTFSETDFAQEVAIE